MSKNLSRRAMLRRTTGALLAGTAGFPFCLRAREQPIPPFKDGVVVGENEGMRVGLAVLADGGNAVDAVVAAALAASIAAPSRSGIGGYGGHMIVALDGGKKIGAIDFNTAAPAAARPDMFPLDQKGSVIDRKNFFGWHAVGVPGVLAGMQIALERYGTRSFREMIQPAIGLAEKGIVVGKTFANTLRGCAPRFAKDPGSASLYLRSGKPPKEGDVLRNPHLAEMLSTLAKRNSVDSFYRGDIAQRIADAFQKHGGLVTSKDLGAYRARDVKSLELQFGQFTVLTAPLTAAGLTILQALSILKSLGWNSQGNAGPVLHAQLEALRLAWKDRLELFGDPDQVKVPVEKLLSADYARELAGKVRHAVDEERKPVDTGVQKHTDEGTNNLCAVDKHGNMVAVTLTHGGSFGAQVTVDGLGLTLGHGMSRFDPHPVSPNAPGPGKRPVHNMCPSLVLREGVPEIAIGAAGGVRIPNTIYSALTEYLVRGASLDAAIAAPRLQCTGTLDVAVEPGSPKDTAEYLRQIGFRVQTWESSSVASAVSFDPKSRECRAAIRGPAALNLDSPKGNKG
jgi:gamma-glutamyltranspeptidase/glutathione hydrolase